jgi:hypothetical protein
MYNGVSYSNTCNTVSGSLVNGLVGYWPFCGNANDQSGNGNNGTVNGATLTTDRFGNSNSAYSFDGITNDITFQQLFTFNSSNNATLSIWLNGQNPPNSVQGTFLKSRLNQIDNNRFNLFVNPINQGLKLNVDYRESNFNIHILNIDTIQTGNWTNLVLTRNNNIYSTYINGQLSSTSIDNNPILPNSIGWILGNDPSSNSDYAGKLDDIGIWNRALSQQEITQLYNQNQCITNITVTDTLIINVGQVSYINPVVYANNITIYPNPANTQVNISFNNITDLTGGSINIINSLGQQVATTPITISGTNTTLSLNTWGGTGLYYVQILNAQGTVVDVKKIILQ